VSVTSVRHSRSPRALLFSLVSVPLILVSTPGLCAGTPAAQCASAYENAQLLRQRGKLVAAREQAAICAREQCPEVARHDCAHWTEELGREVPSVVVVARDESDHDVAVQRIFVDGVPRAELVSGRAIELDPGAHVFRVERADALPAEQSFTVYQGERDRILRVTVSSSTPALAAPPSGAPVSASPAAGRPPAPTTATTPAAPPDDRPSYAPAAIVAGLSLVSLGASAYLGLTGRHDLSGLRSSCAPNCTDAQVDPVRTRLIFSDVTLGVGVVGGAISAYLFAHTAALRAAAPNVEIAPTAGGAAAVFVGRF
jgi:hypothetical protein